MAVGLAEDRCRAGLRCPLYDERQSIFAIMLVLNLSCADGHLFEGWFGSADDYESQRERRLLSCPVCGQQEVKRLPSAPRLNVSGLREAVPNPLQARAAERVEASASDAGADSTPEHVQQRQLQLQRLALQAMRQIVASTEDVGERFAEEARRMHYGEAEERGIRGRASAEDARALAEEGIAVLALPDLPADKLQ